jgi:hypothetical protein
MLSIRRSFFIRRRAAFQNLPICNAVYSLKHGAVIVKHRFAYYLNRRKPLPHEVIVKPLEVERRAFFLLHIRT